MRQLSYLFFIDVCNESDIKDAHEVVKKHVGDLGLNVLINNAGILTGERKIEDVTPSVMMETFRTNVIGPTMLIKVCTIYTCDHSYTILALYLQWKDKNPCLETF